MQLLVCLSLLLLVVFGANRFPVIGIVTQDNEYGWPPTPKTYIAASYVKYVEAAGARVVPIFYTRNDTYLDRMVRGGMCVSCDCVTSHLHLQFGQVNAVLFPGGGQV
jgi:hypothetical protein